MDNVVPFTRSTRRLRRCAKCNLKSTRSTTNSQNSSLTAKRIVGAANVFQILALENRYALEALERLGRQMLAETRARTVAR